MHHYIATLPMPIAKLRDVSRRTGAELSRLVAFETKDPPIPTGEGEDFDNKLRIALQQNSPAKTMFELSRETDKLTHFDPLIHTLAAISAGIDGHVPLTCREFPKENLPSTRQDRNDWVDDGVNIIIRQP